MSGNFSSVHNHHEAAVYQAVLEFAPHHPGVAASPDFLADVACVALNALPPRYIRHSIDMSFYLTDEERLQSAAAVNAAVRTAFAFVASRIPSVRRD